MQAQEIPNSQENPEINLEPQLDQKLKKIIEREGFIKYNIEKRCVSTNGGNYFGLLYEVDIKGTTKDGNKEINLFIKNIVNVETVKVVNVVNAFNTEMFAYKELSQIFAELQEKANVPVNERYKMAKVYEESDTDAIIMENLSRRGFTTYYRMDLLSLEFIESAVKQLATLHALSFVLEDRKPQYFDKNIKSLKYSYVFEEWRPMFNALKISTMEHIDEKYKDAVEKWHGCIIEKFEQFFNDDNLRKCICHCDFRPNNIMTKIEDGEIKDIIPVDYQMLQYSCPAMDLIYLLYFCSDLSFRRIHLTHLKDLYYGTIQKFLAYFDIDAGAVYSREEFENIYEECMDYGLMTALIHYPFIFASEDNLPDVTEDQKTKTFKLDDRFKGRMCDVLQEFHELGRI